MAPARVIVILRQARSLLQFDSALFVSALVAVALGTVGCPGTLENVDEFRGFRASVSAEGAAGDVRGIDADAEDAGCPDVPTLLAERCATTGCHVGPMPATNLDLKSPGLRERLIGTKGYACSGDMANPRDPDHSLMITKMQPNPNCGGRMPGGDNPVSAAEIQCVRAWIIASDPGQDAGVEAGRL